MKKTVSFFFPVTLWFSEGRPHLAGDWHYKLKSHNWKLLVLFSTGIKIHEVIMQLKPSPGSFFFLLANQNCHGPFFWLEKRSKWKAHPDSNTKYSYLGVWAKWVWDSLCAPILRHLSIDSCHLAFPLTTGISKCIPQCWQWRRKKKRWRQKGAVRSTT